MTEPEDFLTRWSRRKREAKADEPSQRDHEALPAEPADEEREAAQAKAKDTPARFETGESAPSDIFDLSKLPSLDSIGPSTDIRMFMQRGVPEALSRAALRRAWSADPAIRDFIGLSENSWDFTASDGMPGFGALDPADAKRLLSQLFTESDSKDDKTGDAEKPDARTELAANDAELHQDEAAGFDDPALASESVSADDMQPAGNTADVPAASQQEDASVALQQKELEPSRVGTFVPRTRGRALPQ